MEAMELARSFQQGGGFQALVAVTDGLAASFEALGPGQPLDDHALPELVEPLDAASIAARLEADGMPPAQAAAIVERGLAALHPTGSVAEDLMDAGVWQWHEAFLAAVASEGRSGVHHDASR